MGVTCMRQWERQMSLTKSGALGRVIGWANFSHWEIVHEFVEIFNVLLGWSSIYFACSDDC